MNNQNNFTGFTVNGRLSIFIAMLLAGLALGIIMVPIAGAQTIIYVRSGGNDTYCNGKTNVDYQPGIAPHCAVKTIQQGLKLAGPDDQVNFSAGGFSAIISGEDKIGIASTSLSISKSDTPDPVNAGDPLTYTIIVTNTGVASATNVRVLDTLPAENIVTYVAGTATTSNGSPCAVIASSPPVISCTLGVLNSGMTATVTIPVTPTAAGVANNIAVVSSPDANNQTVEEDTTFIGETDFSVSKSDTPDPVPVGLPLTYTVVVTNNGPVAAIAVTLTDFLPANTNFVSSSPGPPVCNEVTNVVTCTLGFLGDDESTTVTFVVTPTIDGLITNTATVTGSGTDIDPNNNVATETTNVIPAADLSISKSDSPDPVAPGDPLTYTLTIVNNGLSTAQNVVVTDTLPLSVTVTSVDPVTTTQNGQQLIWNLGPMNSGASQTITVSVTVDSNASGVITNVAEVSSATLDPDLVNNVVTATTLVTTGGPSTSYLPIILKDFAGPFASMSWLHQADDKVREVDGSDPNAFIPDGRNDGAFQVTINTGTSGSKTVSSVILNSSQSGNPSWDTIINGIPVLGIFDGSTQQNNADGTISKVVNGQIIVTIYASDDAGGTRFPEDTYDYTVLINFSDGTSASAVARIPATPPSVLSYVSDVAADADSNQIFIASPRHNWVYVIDGSSDTVSRTVPVGTGPTGLTVLSATVPTNNKVFVAHQYGANFWRPGVKAFGVNETSSHNTFDTGYAGVAPIKIASNGANNSRVYVSNYNDKLAVLDGASGPPENRLGWVVQKAFQGPYGIDTSLTTNRVYLATRDTGELVVFDGNNDRLLQSNYVPTHVKPPQTCSLWSVAVNPATGHVFVPCPQLSKVFVLEEGGVSVLSLEALGVLEERDGNWALVVSPAAAPWIPDVDVPGGMGLGEEGIAVDPNTGYVFITNAGNDTVVILQDGTTPAYVSSIAVGDQPQGIDVNSTSQKVYVGNTASNDVTVFEATSPFSLVTTISLTP